MDPCVNGSVARVFENIVLATLFFGAYYKIIYRLGLRVKYMWEHTR